MLLDRTVRFLTSLRLTVFCLACALVLVFAGTLAQVHLGLYVTQERYFHSLFVFWTIPGTSWSVPVWPGGYLLGAVLLVNLIAAHIKRFDLSRKKVGLFLIHAGLILLFVGQFLTETFQVESFMRLEEGETKNYTESSRKNELAITDVSSPDRDQVTAIPESRLAERGEIQLPNLPFRIRVKEYFPNSSPAPAMASVAGNIHRIEATQGIGQRLRFQPREATTKTDESNFPAALVEVLAANGSLGSWIVTTWFQYPGDLKRMMGGQLASLLDAPQEFTLDNRKFQLSIRPVRYYKPYSISLLDFTHKRYNGTEIPKDFSSKIRVQNPAKSEDREVLIYMNNPLRYEGETYYQGGFLPGDTVSILQVVRNPAWLTPYFSCTLVGIGLTVQFLMHLFGFAKKRSVVATAPAALRGQKGAAPSTRGEPASNLAAESVLSKSLEAAAVGGSKRRSS